MVDRTNACMDRQVDVSCVGPLRREGKRPGSGDVRWRVQRDRRGTEDEERAPSGRYFIVRGRSSKEEIIRGSSSRSRLAFVATRVSRVAQASSVPKNSGN